LKYCHLYWFVFIPPVQEIFKILVLCVLIQGQARGEAQEGRGKAIKGGREAERGRGKGLFFINIEKLLVNLIAFFSFYSEIIYCYLVFPLFCVWEICIKKKKLPWLDGNGSNFLPFSRWQPQCVCLLQLSVFLWGRQDSVIAACDGSRFVTCDIE